MKALRFDVRADEMRAAGVAAGLALPWPPPPSDIARLGGEPPGDPVEARPALVDLARAFVNAPGAAFVAITIITARGPSRLCSWQRFVDGVVVSLTAADADLAEITVVPQRRWGDLLTRLARRPDPTTDPQPPRELPWELLIATGAARRLGRPELTEAMVADWAERHEETDPGDLADQIRSAHAACRGQLSAVLTRGERVGVVSWLLTTDGWCRLAARVSAAGVPVVEIAPTGAEDLGAQLEESLRRAA